MADKKLKVRTTGIRVAFEERKGTICNLKGSNLVKVIWDCKDGEHDSAEFVLGEDENGGETYHLDLDAVHSYIKVTGAAAEGGHDDAVALNGVYVMCNDSFIPEFRQLGGCGRISFEENRWVMWSTLYGQCEYFYINLSDQAETLEVPEKGWEPKGCYLEDEYSPAPTLSKHELEVGQDVKLRKHHPDNHIPAEKYPGPPCSFNHGDICTVERIQGLFFAPKISPNEWIPLRAAVPVSEIANVSEVGGDDTPTRLAKTMSKTSKKPKEAKKAKADPKAAGGGANAIKLIKTLVAKVDNLETEVKKLQN